MNWIKQHTTLASFITAFISILVAVLGGYFFIIDQVEDMIFDQTSLVTLEIKRTESKVLNAHKSDILVRKNLVLSEIRLQERKLGTGNASEILYQERDALLDQLKDLEQ